MYRARRICCRLSRLFCHMLVVLSLSTALLLLFEQVVWASAPSYVHHLWGNNDRQLPATLTAWKEIDLVYERLFPYDRARQPHPPAGCVVLTAMSDHIDKQGTGIKMPPAVLMLRCQERIDLLRPARWVSNRLHQQNRQGYLWLSIPEMGIMDVQVQLVAVRSSSFNPVILEAKSTASRPVVGLFVRHTMNVKQYTFKDTMTGKLDQVKATPNHPFYAVNRQRYIPVSDLSSHDRLVNVMGHPVTLVCPPGKSSHCGQPYHPGQVITVYNLEVYGQHRYFVGDPGIMVHNAYQCGHCGRKFYKEYLFDSHLVAHIDATDAEVKEKPYACEVCGKRFKQPNQFTRHFKIHNKLFECVPCNKKFVDEVGLQKHFSTQNHKAHALAIKKLYSKDAPTDAPSITPSSSEETEGSRERSRSPISFPAPPPLKPELLEFYGDAPSLTPHF